MFANIAMVIYVTIPHCLYNLKGSRSSPKANLQRALSEPAAENYAAGVGLGALGNKTVKESKA